MEPKTAIATSLLVVGVTSLVAVIPHARGRPGPVADRLGIRWDRHDWRLFGGRLAAYPASRGAAAGICGDDAGDGGGHDPWAPASTAGSSPPGSRVPRAYAHPSVAALHGLMVGRCTGLVGAGRGLPGGSRAGAARGAAHAGGRGDIPAGHRASSPWQASLGTSGTCRCHGPPRWSSPAPPPGGRWWAVGWSAECRRSVLRQTFGWVVLVMSVFLVTRQVPAWLGDSVGSRRCSSSAGRSTSAGRPWAGSCCACSGGQQAAGGLHRVRRAVPGALRSGGSAFVAGAVHRGILLGGVVAGLLGGTP